MRDSWVQEVKTEALKCRSHADGIALELRFGKRCTEVAHALFFCGQIPFVRRQRNRLARHLNAGEYLLNVRHLLGVVSVQTDALQPKRHTDLCAFGVRPEVRGEAKSRVCVHGVEFFGPVLEFGRQLVIS